jgi:hypothetical protein
MDAEEDKMNSNVHFGDLAISSPHPTMISPTSRYAGANLAMWSLSPPPLHISKVGNIPSIQDFEATPRPVPHQPHNTRNPRPSELSSLNATPRATGHKTHEKSSSYGLLRSQTPKLLSRLRSFSKDRVSSSRATCRRYSTDSSVSSTGSVPSHQSGRFHSSQERASNFGSSSSEGSYDPDPVMPLCFDGHGLGMQDQRRGNIPKSYLHEPTEPFIEPSLLIPQVRVVPEMTTIQSSGTTVWVAIEVFGQIYGRLYEAHLDLIPTEGNTILDLMDGEIPKRISPGSSHLTLALLRLGPSSTPRKPSADAFEPDVLIADLEHHLGDTRTNFLEVSLSYSHSGFPQTQLKTMATGTVKRHNPSSV